MTKYVAVLEVHARCSADYASVKSTVTHIFEPSDTVEAVMNWRKRFNHCLGLGDMVLTEADADAEQP